MLGYSGFEVTTREAHSRSLKAGLEKEVVNRGQG